MTDATDGPVFRAIFESSLDAILLTAPDGRILAANPAAETMFGRTEAEIVSGGRHLLVDLSDSRLEEAIRERERVGRFRGDLRFLRGDGSCFEGEASSVLFHDAEGEPRTAMVIHDISERTAALKRVRESEGRFQALAEAAFEGIVIHDAGRILDVNPAASTLFGYSEEALRTMGVVDLLTGEEAARAQSLIDQGGTEQLYETCVVTADGRVRAIEVSARPISYEGRPARVAAVRDVTEQRRAARALEEQNLRLRELDALKSEFVALVSTSSALR